MKREREAAAQAYFQAHAADWDRIRALHVAEDEVEQAIVEALGRGPFKLLVDLGTGTGRMLELFADRYERGLGFDLNHAMLAYARSKLSKAKLARAQVRHGDIYALALPDGVADASSCIRCCTSCPIRHSPSARPRACWRPAAGC